MSGWIKVEKDLLTDPRLVELSRTCLNSNAFVTHSNACVTLRNALAFGLLTKLWCIVDTHIDKDNKMAGSSASLNEMLGVEGFCEALPECWFIDHGDGTLEFPGYQQHNGVEAKKKALNARRQQAHRDRQKSPSEEPVTPPSDDSNADALRERYQTKTKTKTNIRIRDSKESSYEKRKSKQGYTEEFERFWTAWRKTGRGQGKKQAFVEWNKLDGHRPSTEALIGNIQLRLARDWDWMKDSGKWIPHAERYLKNERWDDDLAEQPKGVDHNGRKLTRFEQQELAVRKRYGDQSPFEADDGNAAGGGVVGGGQTFEGHLSEREAGRRSNH